MSGTQFVYRSDKEKCESGYFSWLIGCLVWFFDPLLPGYGLGVTVTWIFYVAVYLFFLALFPITYPLLILIKMMSFKRSMCGGCDK